MLELLKKYGMESCDPIDTQLETKKNLDLDKNRTLVDATKYRSMIGALMYLTSSRPDIIHTTCLCARYQALPTEKHLKESDIAISCNAIQHSRTKHVEKGTIELYFVKTDYQLADIFTKALLVDRFNYLVHLLGMHNLSQQELERLAKSHQNRRDLPRDTPIDRLEVLRSMMVTSVKPPLLSSFPPSDERVFTIAEFLEQYTEF
ncbi:hypothetical protein Tco_1228699 [Tanacetum coccineum]